MHALILAGGPGSRLGMGEKPLVLVDGTPMILSVIDAFRAAGCEVTVILTRKTPYTHTWCRAQGIPHYTASGNGYIDDIIESVGILDISGPFFTSVADLPLLGADLIRDILDVYRKSGKPALSTWVPKSIAEECRSRIPYVEKVGEVEACPAGINILRGDQVGSPQEEERILIHDPRLAYNVNTREALAQALFMKSCNKQG
ncbi:MAG: Adenosylcobinamide-phosphate guanylyltransferase [Methanoregulaceae archaeon PtaB.Bin108]|nr:MAG: Adenosylcobinamide-phosphate guanylyltransferase [Methanoregulaceae archaeon PtaB.Bin108]